MPNHDLTFIFLCFRKLYYTKKKIALPKKAYEINRKTNKKVNT